MPDNIIPKHGGYAKLQSYRKAQIIYDATVYFVGQNLFGRDRTVDQMVQAARSGKQNIVEGSQASGTSREFEIKLTNVARASLEELLEDYRDFLRIHGYSEWGPEHPYTRRMRELCRNPDADYKTFQKGIEHKDVVIGVNVIIGLIKLCCYLLDKQVKAQEKIFLEEGGLREAMTRARIAKRKRT